MKIDNKKFKEIKELGNNWFVLLIWIIILLVLVQTVGIVIHEAGHYSAGKFFGCDNLSISIAKLSWQDSISNVSGWEYCKVPLVMVENGSRVCNFKTNVVNFSGLGLSLLVFVPFLIFINLFFKKKYPKLYLRGHFFAIILIFTVGMIIQSAIYDLFKVGECLFNTPGGEIIFQLIKAIPTITNLLIVMFFLIDLINVFSFFIKIKQTSKKQEGVK